MIKRFVYISACMLAVYTTANRGVHLGTVITIPYLCVGWMIARAIDKRMEMVYYENLRENIYESSLHPGDKEVVKRVNDHRRKLRDSGNPLYNYPRGPQIDVVYWIYRDHLNPTESWESFEERKTQGIEEATRATALNLFALEDKAWYEGVVMGQIGAWKEPKIQDIEFLELD